MIYFVFVDDFTCNFHPISQVLLDSNKTPVIISSLDVLFDILCNENPIYVFPKKELRGLSPNFHIHVSVCVIYIFPELLHIFSCSKIGRPIVEIYKSLTDT
jgi:hypothetical protein